MEQAQSTNKNSRFYAKLERFGLGKKKIILFPDVSVKVIFLYWTLMVDIKLLKYH